MKKIVCDMCGCTIADCSDPFGVDPPAKLNVNDVGYQADKEFDLCTECTYKVIDYIKKRRIEHTYEKEEATCSGELYPGEFESRHYEFEEE